MARLIHVESVPVLEIDDDGFAFADAGVLTA